MKKVLNNYSSKNDINIRQIVAYKDNILEIEEYKEGFSKEDTMNVMSVTKSITSLLIGIAIDKGYIKSIDEYVMDYYKNKEKEDYDFSEFQIPNLRHHYSTDRMINLLFMLNEHEFVLKFSLKLMSDYPSLTHDILIKIDISEIIYHENIFFVRFYSFTKNERRPKVAALACQENLAFILFAESTLRLSVNC